MVQARDDIPAPDRSRGLVVVCTRNRPDDVRTALAAVAASAPGIEVLVADSSDPGCRLSLEALVAEHDREYGGAVLLDCTPGLARQRNQALEWILRHRADVPYVFFIDDDTEVLPGYFAAVRAVFERRPEVAGVGGVVLNQPWPRHIAIKSLFHLYSRVPGRVMPSGRSTHGHYQGHEAEDPQWLPGCAMSYRLDAIADRRFDERLEGYSLGEDLYFSFALRAEHRLAIAPDAQVLHHFSASNRVSRVRLQQDKTPLLHRFVRENRDRGLRPGAFWWSVFGDALLKCVDGIARRDRDMIAESGSIVRSALHTLRHPLPTRPPSATEP